MIKTQGTSMPGTSAQPSITEYSIRVPKNLKPKHHVMRFNYNLNVDFSKWRNGVKMERENNMREYKAYDDDMPKFGAGSEYKREEKEEARRKKFGIIAKKYDPERQPWILKVGQTSKGGKKFRGIREGGVSENAAHFIFTQTKDGSIEAFPLYEWYNFQPVQRYNTLTAEEAEEEFGRRKKCVNMWTMKMRMKLKNKEDEEVEFDPEETKAVKSAKGGDKKKLQISEMDEWMDSDDISSDSDEEEKKKEEEDDSDDEKSKKKAKGKVPPKKKKKDVDDEAFEESDDGDEEGRERDYISDSSESDSEPETKANKELKSVAEEDALRKLLTSDEESDEEKSNKDEEESEEERKKEDMPSVSDSKPEKSKEKKKDVDKKTKMQKVYDAINNGAKSGNKSDFSSDSDDSDVDKVDSKGKKKPKIEKNASRSGTPVDATPAAVNKRKAEIASHSENSNSPQSTPAKKIKTEAPSAMSSNSYTNFTSSNKEGFAQTEAAVRRYLMRKPMTTTELLKKIQSKRTGVSSDELVAMMTSILKRINPTKQRIQGKMYLSLKATS